MPHTTTVNDVEDAIDGVRARRNSRRTAEAAAADAVFRATVEQRLGALEGGLGEVKNRINGLLFLVAGAVIVQVIQRLVHW